MSYATYLFSCGTKYYIFYITADKMPFSSKHMDVEPSADKKNRLAVIHLFHTCVTVACLH